MELSRIGATDNSLRRTVFDCALFVRQVARDLSRAPRLAQDSYKLIPTGERDRLSWLGAGGRLVVATNLEIDFDSFLEHRKAHFSGD